MPFGAIYNLGMTVYLEYAFLDNFTMDCLLLFCAAVTLKIRFRIWRVVLGALAGSVITLATVNVGGFLSYLCKAACLFSMCVVSVGFGKKLFWHILLTLAYTFVTGGAIVGIFNLLQVDYVTENGLCYNMPVPLFVYFVALLFAAILCYCIVTFVKQSKRVAPYLKKVKVILDKTYDVVGFCDSGNSVVCDGLPVCFVTKKFGNVSAYFAEQILHGKTKQTEVATLNGKKKVTVVKAALEIGKTKREIYLALPVEKCQTQYELLLNGEFCDLQ